jgi:DNA-binding response OmpR family regulator
MHKKEALVVARGLEVAKKLKKTISHFDVDASFVGMSEFFDFVKKSSTEYGVVVLDIGRAELMNLPKVEEELFNYGAEALFIVIAEEDLDELKLPMKISSDFVCANATEKEYYVRFHHLLWPGEEASSEDFIRQDNLTLNLATFQVTIDGIPLDLTYLEYALLSFLITHPGKTYSRDTLLKRVWGFDYYGGSRTVDVHVRRLRAKLGPDLSQNLNTIRGVGYLWTQ